MNRDDNDPRAPTDVDAEDSKPGEFPETHPGELAGTPLPVLFGGNRHKRGRVATPGEAGTDPAPGSRDDAAFPDGNLRFARQKLVGVLRAGARAPGRSGARLQRELLTPSMRRRRRQRLVFQSVVITFMLISSWIMVMLGVQVIGKKMYNFRAETQRVLEQIRDGHADEVYEDASPELRATIARERFEARATDINRTLGGFRRILALKTQEILSGPRGETGGVRATLEFDKGKTTGSLSFHKIDGEWRLLGFGVMIPPELLTARSNLEQVARNEAPAEVLALARRILERVRDGEGGEVFDEASPLLQQSVGSREMFLRRIEARRQSLGRFVSVLDFTKHAQDSNSTNAKLTAVAQFEHAKTDVQMAFINLDGTWRLRTFKVVVPAPRIPMLDQTAAADDPE